MVIYRWLRVSTEIVNLLKERNIKYEKYRQVNRSVSHRKARSDK